MIDNIVNLNLSREMIPNKWLSSKEIWQALLPSMPAIALLRNINKMSLCDAFDNDFYKDMLSSKINSLNVHPIQLLISLKMYSSGQGDKGSLTWEPRPWIVKLLNDAFKKCFDKLQKTNKRYLIALDVSGSMGWGKVCGIDCLTPAEVACAMAMAIDTTTECSTIKCFADTFRDINVSKANSLEVNLNTVKKTSFGATDISLPFTWALEQKEKYDAVIVLTDSETNSNSIKPVDAFRMYKTKMNSPDTKLIVCALESNGFTIADPDDKHMLDIAGFDACTPDIIRQFVEGEF